MDKLTLGPSMRHDSGSNFARPKDSYERSPATLRWHVGGALHVHARIHGPIWPSWRPIALPGRGASHGR